LIVTKQTGKRASFTEPTKTTTSSTKKTGSRKTQAKSSAATKASPLVTPTTVYLAKKRQSDGTLTLTTTRVLLKLHIDTAEDEGTTERALELLGALLETYQKRDIHVAFIPWTFADMDSLPPIMDPIVMANMLVSKFRPYTDGFRPKPSKPCWFQMAIVSEEPQHLLSNDYSDASGWFEDNKCGAFLCAVQNSDNTVPLGDLLYSGPFVNPERVAASIQKRCMNRYKKPLKFGCRLKRNWEIPKADSLRPFLLAESQIVHIEVDSSDAKNLKKVLHHGFNRRDDNFMLRPGSYGFRFQPDKTQMRPGTDGEEKRHSCLRKHSGIVQKLTLIKSFDIKELDKPIASNGKEYALREFLLTLTVPNQFKSDGSPRPAFHSVDRASQGKERGKAVYFTAYVDLAGYSESLVGVLPALVNAVMDKSAALAWFHVDALDSLNDVVLNHDEDGNWDGTWTTSEDDYGDTILDEDLGIEFDFTTMEEFGDEVVLLTADDTSVNTYGTELGQRAPTETQQTGSVAHAVEAAVTGDSDCGPSV
jgi:hypothetical protein